MKTLKLIAPLVCILMLVSSCTKEEYYEDNGYKGNWFATEVTVPYDKWELVGKPDEIGSFYIYEVYIKELDTKYYNDAAPYYDGVISVAMYQNYKQSNEIQFPLPHIIYGVGYDPKGDEVYYSVQYSYDLQANGKIAFKIYVSDYLTNGFSLETKTFKISASW